MPSLSIPRNKQIIFCRSPSPIGSHRRRRTPSPVKSSRTRKNYYNSPSPSRSRSRAHSRHHSRSPRRISPANRRYSSDSRSRSPTNLPSAKKFDIKDKITDTSFFAELIKDKHKRQATLKKILEKQEGASNTVAVVSENSLSNDCVITTVDSSSTANSNGLKDVSITDIPMPDQTDSSSRLPESVAKDTTVDVPSVDGSSAADDGSSKDSRIPVILNSKSSESIDQPSASQPSEPTTTTTTTTTGTETKSSVLSKPKSLTNLPMPPGVNVAELEGAQTPSPPRQISPVAGAQMKVMPIPTLTTTGAITTPNLNNNNSHQQPHHTPHKSTGSSSSSTTTSKRSSSGGEHKTSSAGTSGSTSTSSKKGVLNLPMPPMVPGSEDLSGDEDIGSPPPVSDTPTKKSSSGIKYSKTSSSSKKPKGRPRILNRRFSRNMLGPMSASGGKDWGERCVDVFDVIDQIGEGTYGQVCSTVVMLSLDGE